MNHMIEFYSFRDRLTTEQMGKLTGLLQDNTTIEGFR